MCTTRDKLSKLTVLLLLCSCTFNSERTFTDSVNPFIGSVNYIYNAEGAMGMGKTHPGATTPFGMSQVSPNTANTNENASGYHYPDQYIDGFAFTQLSGTGCAEMGNLLVSATTGPLRTNSGIDSIPGYSGKIIPGYRSRMDKGSEVAKPGYYSVNLADYDIKAEATASPHGGIVKYTFPRSSQSRIQLDLSRRLNGTASIQRIRVIDDRTLAGEIECNAGGGGWCTGKVEYTLYFYARLSKPMGRHGVWVMDIPDSCSRKEYQFKAYGQNHQIIRETPEFQELASKADVITDVSEFEGRHIGFFAEFDTEDDGQVEFQAAISYVSQDGAQRNFEAELEGRDFESIRRQAQAQWESCLSSIRVSGGTEAQRIIFYTALYHALLDPRIFSDVDGRYHGGDGRVQREDGFTRRTIFSGWDVFRSEMPLLTIIRPDVVDDILMSLVTLAEESGKGYLERWELLNAYTSCMVGNPAVSVLADAYFKGVWKHDIERAYRLADSTSRMFGNSIILKGGCYASISDVLEYAYSEWCMAKMAEALGKEEDAAFYDSLAQSYKSIFDSEKRSFRPVMPDGSFLDWPSKGILDFNYGCVESNPFQQQWFVPHDVDGLVELLGGREQTVKDLDRMFESTPSDFRWNEYYNHSNEPVHHVPYLYNRLGQSWKTQKWTRAICDGAYGDTVEGLIGNEDVGQMSAWYVLSASGLHPVCPGDTRYEITSPLFGEVEFNLPNGKTFTIRSRNNSSRNIYIQSASLNGKEYEKCWIDYKDIVSGGVLELDMGPLPATEWGK